MTEIPTPHGFNLVIEGDGEVTCALHSGLILVKLGQIDPFHLESYDLQTLLTLSTNEGASKFIETLSTGPTVPLPDGSFAWGFADNTQEGNVIFCLRRSSN